MRKFARLLASEGGHVITCLFVFLVGIGLVVGGFELGREVVIGSLASLWTALKTSPNKSTGSITGGICRYKPPEEKVQL